MKAKDIHQGLEKIQLLMVENKDYLLTLDQAFGDGDLGISMEQGFSGVLDSWDFSEEDLGKLFLKISRDFNENAPSSLGTILSFGLMGIAKILKGKHEVTAIEFIQAMKKGVETIEQKAESKEGEKTILDALIPAIQAMISSHETSTKKLFEIGAKAAKQGAENTKDMMAVHGRAAYHKEKTLGHVDGGAFVGKLIFEGILRVC